MVAADDQGTPAAADGGPDTGPLARAAELRMQLQEERLRRQRAEARAEAAEALAEVSVARSALAAAQAADAEAIRQAAEREREAGIALLRTGLIELRAELDDLRALAVAVERATVVPPEAPVVAVSAVRTPRTTTDPSLRMTELARGARELLAGGRLDAADEVIRGLEDAAERLRAQAPPPTDPA